MDKQKVANAPVTDVQSVVPVFSSMAFGVLCDSLHIVCLLKPLMALLLALLDRVSFTLVNALFLPQLNRARHSWIYHTTHRITLPISLLYTLFSLLERALESLL